MSFKLNYLQFISFWSLGGTVRWTNKQYKKYGAIDKPMRVRKFIKEGIVRKHGDMCISCREETQYNDECVIENISKTPATLYLTIRDGNTR